MNAPERIRITHDDVFSPKVDEVLAREGSFGMRPDQMAAMMNTGKKKVNFFYSSIFYTALAGALGACLGWLIVEPFVFDADVEGAASGIFDGFWGSVLLITVVITPGAVFIGAVEGVASRNWSRALTGAAIGLGVGFGGMLVIGTVIELLYMIMCGIVIVNTGHDLDRPLTYMLLTLCRALAWAPMGVAIGLAPAIAMRSGKLAFNGIVGGLLGAFSGGLLFNPLASLFYEGDAWVSRGIGFTAIGLGAGVMIGLVENLAKTAWLHVQAGALAGKQFVLYKNPTVLGSSPKCEIYLFKDEAIEPKHAAIHAYGTRYEIEDLDSPAGTFVNGRKVTRQPLKNGDRIYIGETVLDFSEKESG